MNPPSPSTLSGWAFGSATPIVMPQVTPSLLLPRPQIRMGGVPVDVMRPRVLFPGIPAPRLSSGPRLHAVADPNAPAAPPVVAADAAVPSVVTGAVEAPPAPLQDAVAPTPVVGPSMADLTAAFQQFLQQQAAAVQAGGSGSGGCTSNFLVPSTLSGVGGFMGGTPSFTPDLAQSGPHPSRRSDHVGKMPVPQALSSLVKLRDDPDALRLILERYFEYILRAGLIWPTDIRLFVTDLAASKWIQSYLESAHSQLSASGLQFDQNEFISAFVAFVTGEVRPRSIIALQELMGHKITQGSDSVAQYAENFYQRARILSHIPPVVLCYHFVSGLHSNLRKLCCVDREGHDWVSLHTLVQFTLVEERRLTLVSDSAPPDDRAIFRPKRHWPHQGDGYTPAGKKARLAVAAPVAMDVAEPAGARPSYVNAVQRAPVQRPSGPPSGPSGSSGAGPSRLGPPSSCPCFKLNNKGRPLAEWEQKCLSAYGLCWYCKESVAHSAKDCPLKGSKPK